MKCEMCNGKLSKVKEELEFLTPSLGKLLIPNITFFKCNNCGEKLLNPEMSDKITKYVKIKEQEAIDSLPVGEFVSLNEAAEILGITKQAFSKNPKIKRGWIYSTKIGERRYYYQKSLAAFKKKKDGRIPLPQEILAYQPS
ncbi:MAG: YgiT-type zinc finger protein [Planctomycetota bacterium]